MRFPLLTALASAIALTACGGGGGGSSSGQALSRPSVHDLTNSQKPAETAAAIGARAPGIVARADVLFASTMYGTTNIEGYPTFHAPSACAGFSCTWTEQRSGVELTVDESNISASTAGAKAVLTKNGITTLGRSDNDYRTYGAWMSDSAFAVTSFTIRDGGSVARGRYGIAGGDLSGSRPTGTATWRGLMVGMTQGGNRDRLQGDATLTYSLSNTSLNAAFTDIVNIDRRKAHSVSSVGFNNVPVFEDGSFHSGTTGSRITGAFYGSAHGESAGVFEKSGIVGAFGARKN